MFNNYFSNFDRFLEMKKNWIRFNLKWNDSPKSDETVSNSKRFRPEKLLRLSLTFSCFSFPPPSPRSPSGRFFSGRIGSSDGHLMDRPTQNCADPADQPPIWFVRVVSHWRNERNVLPWTKWAHKAATSRPAGRCMLLDCAILLTGSTHAAQLSGSTFIFVRVEGAAARSARALKHTHTHTTRGC